jgi:hypothetical protein
MARGFNPHPATPDPGGSSLQPVAATGAPVVAPRAHDPRTTNKQLKFSALLPITL